MRGKWVRVINVLLSSSAGSMAGGILATLLSKPLLGGDTDNSSFIWVFLSLEPGILLGATVAFGMVTRRVLAPPATARLTLWGGVLAVALDILVLGIYTGPLQPYISEPLLGLLLGDGNSTPLPYLTFVIPAISASVVASVGYPGRAPPVLHPYCTRKHLPSSLGKSRGIGTVGPLAIVMEWSDIGCGYVLY